MNKLITLDASSASDLDWDLISEGPYFLDFGWEKKPLNPFNPADFSNALLAVEEFAKRNPEAKEVVLLNSDGDLGKLFQMTEGYTERKKESPLSDALFTANLLSEYLHRLASVLPDETTPQLHFSLEEDSDFAHLVLLLCRRRFEHFQLLFSNLVIPIEGEAPLCVCLPQDDKYCEDSFSSLFSILKGKPFICIPEELLNEHWDGLDTVLYDPELIGEMGLRMLEGFEAAGGEVIQKSQVETWLKSE